MTLESLLAAGEALTAMLLHHINPGAVMAADVVKLDAAKTAPSMEGPALRGPPVLFTCGGRRNAPG
ncbi:MAG: hypothetical protein JW819_00630 [Candidatus Krumholzibacteriota bacterium]|nr:hypothetical protein [Candidatus Krumholzibacteriota bacterium]